MRELKKNEIAQIVDTSDPIETQMDVPIHFSSRLANGGTLAFIRHWDRIFRLQINASGQLELLT